MANSDNKITTETLVSVTELAATLGLTASRIYQLISDGRISTVARGKLNLCESVQSYIDYIKDKDASDDEKKNETARKKAEAMMKTSKAIIAKIEAEEMTGKMHRAQDVEDFTSDLILYFRDALLSLPGRLAKDVNAASSANEAYEIIRSESIRLIRELASYKYDPRRYDERVKKRALRIEGVDHDDAEDADT